MSTREKILVGLMIVAVCLGGLLWATDGQEKKTSQAAVGQPKPLTQMLTRATAQFGSPSSLEDDRYTLSLAQTPWRKNLFAEGPDRSSAIGERSNGAEALPANVSLVYSGYIETPRRRVAIINGIEYVVGDQLDQSIYKIRHIAPTEVVLVSPQERMVSIPLVDNWGTQAPNP